MKLPVKLNWRSLPGLVRQHVHIVLWVFLLVIIAMEAFLIKGSVDMILAANATAPGAQAQIVRVNFEQYKLIEKRLEDDAQFSPEPVKYTSPFGQPPQ